MTDKEKLRELWKHFFHHLYDVSTYCELLCCCYLSVSKVHLGEETAKHNIEIRKKYNYFFNSMEHGLGYAVVLSITQLFEDGKNKKQRTLAYLLNEAKKLNIDRDSEFEELKQKHFESLKMLKKARDTYFAHRDKHTIESEIPSRNKMLELINDIARLLNSIGKDFENGGESYLWKDEETGWSKHIREDFQRVLDNLYRGESARLRDIRVKHLRKLYNDGQYDWPEMG